MIQDLHVHTVFSDGTNAISDILQSSQSCDVEIGISDHIFCKKLTTKESIISYFDSLNNYPVLKGAEINIGDGNILDDIIINKADYIIGSVHSVVLYNSKISFGKYFDSRAQKGILNPNFIFDDIVCCKALENIISEIRKEISRIPINIIGHCTVNPFYEQVNSKFRYEWEEELISVCKSNNIAIEISGLWIEPSIDFIRKALKNNVQFTFGSDCHQDYSDSFMNYFKYVDNILEFKQGDLVRFEKR